MKFSYSFTHLLSCAPLPIGSAAMVTLVLVLMQVLLLEILLV